MPIVLPGFRASLLVASVVVAGCGSPHELAPVAGRVTLDGQPVPAARVLLIPQSAGESSTAQPVSLGTTDAGGRYSAATVTQPARDGAVVGQHQVVITTKRTAPNDNPRSEQEIVLAEETIPAPYFSRTDSPLTLDVPPAGTKSADFHLTSPRSQN